MLDPTGALMPESVVGPKCGGTETMVPDVDTSPMEKFVYDHGGQVAVKQGKG